MLATGFCLLLAIVMPASRQ